MPTSLLERVMYPAEALLEVTLASGHLIRAMSVCIGHTYGGLLEGLPSERSNRWHLETLPHRAQHQLGEWPVHIVPPAIKLLDPTPPDAEDPDYAKDPERAPAFMPPLEMMAFFECPRSVDPDMHGSCLIVAWYEHTCPPLMSPATRAQVQQIDWVSHAKDYEF